MSNKLAAPAVLLFSTLVFTCTASAQPLGVGIRLGSTLTNAISSASSLSIPDDHHLIVGPYVELRLPLRFAVEVDALYIPSLYESVTGAGSTWQFPALAKYRLFSGPIRPYVEGGVAFSHITDLGEIPELNHRSNFGIVLGAGLEFKLLVLRVSPEVRYEGWTLHNIVSPDGLFQSDRNQATFDVGFGF